MTNWAIQYHLAGGGGGFVLGCFLRQIKKKQKGQNSEQYPTTCVKKWGTNCIHICQGLHKETREDILKLTNAAGYLRELGLARWLGRKKPFH